MGDFYDYSRDEDGIVTITIDVKNQSVNVMNPAFVDSLAEIVERLEAEILTGVIITSGKQTFITGGDLRYFITVSDEDLEKTFDETLRLKGILRRLETLHRPVVVAINGHALGGGLEICLACHYRIVIDNDRIAIGCPEVTLGLLPGAGGISRMVRMFGLEKAMPYLVGGRLLSPKQAIESGIVDELALDHNDMIKKALRWIKSNPEPLQPWDRKGYQIPGGYPDSPKIQPFLMATRARILARTRGLLPAPMVVFDSMVSGARVDFATAQQIASRGMVKLVSSQVTKNQITLNFLQNTEVKACKSRPKNIRKKKIGTLGVFGAGMMGSGIAYVAAKAGIEVVLKDVTAEKAEKGKAYSAKVLEKAIKKGRATQAGKQEILARIKTTENLQDMASCDLVIEAVFEDPGLKAVVIGETESVLDKTAVLASNTSTLPISMLAESSKRPGNFIGLHFFSPVDRMPLVEIIRGEETTEETIAQAFDFVRQIGMMPILVNDSLGFFTSRVFTTYLDEGVRMLTEGIDPILIENLARQAGMPIGPLKLNDEVSLRLSVEIQESNERLVEQRKLAVSHVQRTPATELVESMVKTHGRLGRAWGGGFYDYSDSGEVEIWPGLNDLVGLNSGHDISKQDIKDRILFRQVIESVKCLQEGVLRSIPEGNVGSHLGFGFPQHTGGVFQFIASLGLEEFVSRCNQLTKKYGERFAAPTMLIDGTFKSVAIT